MAVTINTFLMTSFNYLHLVKSHVYKIAFCFCHASMIKIEYHGLCGFALNHMNLLQIQDLEKRGWVLPQDTTQI